MKKCKKQTKTLLIEKLISAGFQVQSLVIDIFFFKRFLVLLQHSLLNAHSSSKMLFLAIFLLRMLCFHSFQSAVFFVFINLCEHYSYCQYAIFIILFHHRLHYYHISYFYLILNFLLHPPLFSISSSSTSTSTSDTLSFLCFLHFTISRLVLSNVRRKLMLLPGEIKLLSTILLSGRLD